MNSLRKILVLMVYIIYIITNILLFSFNMAKNTLQIANVSGKVLLNFSLDEISLY